MKNLKNCQSLHSKSAQKTLEFWINEAIEEESMRRARIQYDWVCRAQSEFYFHGTQEKHIESIKENGILPQIATGEQNYEISEKEAVYLTKDRREAIDWAKWNRKYKRVPILGLAGQTEQIKEKAFVIWVHKKNVDQSKLKTDGNLGGNTSFEYYGIIKPPFQIEDVSAVRGALND